MILAAGRGTRMRPLSDVVPKPALPLPSGPVVRSAVELAAACGVRRLVANTWHLADTMAAALAGVVPPGIELVISREEQLLGGAGGLARARDRGLLAGADPLLVVNGDGLLRLDLEAVLERHRSGSDDVTLALIPHLEPRRWTRVQLDGRGAVTGFTAPGEPSAGEVPLLYPGVMLVSAAALASLPSGPAEIMPELWRPALERGRLGAAVVAGHWREVGVPADYLEAALARVPGPPVIDHAARVDPTAAIGRAFIGPGAVVDCDAVVGDSVVSHGAHVGHGARVFRSVLLGRVSVAPGTTVVDELRVPPPL